MFLDLERTQATSDKSDRFLLSPLQDLPCGLLSPGRKSSYRAARWFRFLRKINYLASIGLALASEKQVLMETDELSVVPS